MGYQLRPQENKNLLERDWDERNNNKKSILQQILLVSWKEFCFYQCDALDLECPERPMCKRIGPHPVALMWNWFWKLADPFRGGAEWGCFLPLDVYPLLFSPWLPAGHWHVLPPWSAASSQWSKHKARRVLSPPKLGAKGRTFWGWLRP